MAEHPMACPEWQEDLAGWLVAQLPPEREARLVEHLAACGACRHEAESLLAVSAVMLAGAPPDAPLDAPPDAAATPPAGRARPADLVDRAADVIQRERRTRRMVRSGLLALVGASLVVALVASASRVDDAALDGTRVPFVVAPAGASASAVIAEDDGASIVELVATGLDPEVTYALWLSPPGGTLDDRVPAGTFRPDRAGNVAVRLRCALPPDRYDRAWATTPSGAVALDTRDGPTYRG